MSEIKINNNSKLINTRLPLDAVIPENQFFLMKITETKDFVDGKTTDTITGLAFEVVELKNFTHLRVKVEGIKKTFITNEELERIKFSGEHVMVRLVNPTILAYIRGTSIEDSIKADGIEKIELK